MLYWCYYYLMGWQLFILVKKYDNEKEDEDNLVSDCCEQARAHQLVQLHLLLLRNSHVGYHH